MNHLGRLDAFQQAIAEKGLCGAVLFYSRDVYYYTGTAQPSYLLVRPDDYQLCVRRGIDWARRESWLPAEKILAEKSLARACGRLFPGQGQGEKVGLELDLLPASQAPRFGKALGGRQPLNCSPLVLEQRMVKDALEIQNLQAACTALYEGHQAAQEALRPGVSELELAVAIEAAQRRAGHDGMIFFRQHDVMMSRGPVASGPNLKEVSGAVFTFTGRGLSPAMPAGPSRRIMQAGELVLVDIPACVEGYHADQSRMYYLGRPPDAAQEAYSRLRRVVDLLMAGMSPGMTCGQAYALAGQLARQEGVADSFLRFPNGDKAHFVGHGVGLEMNEPPVLAKGLDYRLRSGNVLALEMHLLDYQGHTVKLEDTMHLSDQGCRLLTRAPREIIACPL